MLKVHRISSMEWKPPAVVALTTSADGSQVASARADISLEIWLVSPGSVGWHYQLTIHGDPNSRVSSLVWCRSRPRVGPLGQLLSSSIGNYDVIQQPKNIGETARKNVPFYMFVDEETETYMKNSSILGNDKQVGLWRIIVIRGVPYTDSGRNGKVLGQIIILNDLQGYADQISGGMLILHLDISVNRSIIGTISVFKKKKSTPSKINGCTLFVLANYCCGLETGLDVFSGRPRVGSVALSKSLMKCIWRLKFIEDRVY